MRVLFQNLIGNALKFQNGDEPPGNHRSRRSSSKAFGGFRCAITASASIRRSKIKMFAIFQRIHRKEDYPGTGIGLSTCRKFIQLCGGDIGFEFDTRARHDLFLFPPAWGSLNAMHTRLEILLMEDNEGDVEMTQRILGDGKPVCNVSVANNGMEALDFLFKRGHLPMRPHLSLFCSISTCHAWTARNSWK